MFFSTNNTGTFYFFILVFKAGFGSVIKNQVDPDPHREKVLDPDPQKMNAILQPWLLVSAVPPAIPVSVLVESLVLDERYAKGRKFRLLQATGLTVLSPIAAVPTQI